jgi:hypothetical protein
MSPVKILFPKTKLGLLIGSVFMLAMSTRTAVATEPEYYIVGYNLDGTLRCRQGNCGAPLWSVECCESTQT